MERAYERFAIEKIDNGYLVKVTESGNDKFVGRWAFKDAEELLAWLSKFFGTTS